MPEYIPVERMELSDSGLPEWRKSYPREVWRDTFLLDKVYKATENQPLQERNNLLRIVVEDIIPMKNRYRHLDDEEKREAIALNSKYNHPETGLLNTLCKEYETFVAGLETRAPRLAAEIKQEDSEANVMNKYSFKAYTSEGERSIGFSTGHTLNGIGQPLINKALEAVRDHHIKKDTFREELIQILSRTMEEKGIEKPREAIAIESKLDALSRVSLDDPTLAEGPEQKTGERRDPCPRARPVALVEHDNGSAFTVTFEAVGQPKVLPEWIPPELRRDPDEMEREDLQELLKSMHRFNCGKFFETRVTEEKSPKYHDLVKDRRDLLTIKEDLSNDLQYRAEQFFNDIRLMLDNYSHVFGKGSDEHKMAERFEEAMLKKLEDYGEAGQTAKEQFDRAPRAEFNEIIPSPKADETLPPSEPNDGIDSTIDETENDTSLAEIINKGYEDDYGEGRDDSFFGQKDDILDNGNEQDAFPQTPATVGPARNPGSQDGHVNQSPSFNGPAEQPGDKDDPVEQAWAHFDPAKQYDRDHGHATRAPAGRGTTQPHDDKDGRDSPTTGASGPAEQPNGDDSGILSSIASSSPPPAAQPEAAAGDSGDEAAHAGSHALEHPAPVAPMEVIDLISSPQRPASRIDSASTKRGRESDDQESSSSDDDAPLIKRRKTTVQPSSDEERESGDQESSSDDDAPLIKRRETTVQPSSGEKHVSNKRQKAADEPSSDDDSPPSKRRKTTAEPSSDGNPPSDERQETAAESAFYPVTSSLGKRSRGNDDSDDEEDRGQPSKKSKPLAPVAAAAGDGESDNTDLTIEELFEPFESPPRPVQGPLPPVAAAAPVDGANLADIQHLLRVVQNAQVPPSPVPEPLTPEAAAADEQQSEPATEDLGHTDKGTITASKLHKLPKYKKKSRSEERGCPNRPWVFGYRFGNDYGLYIMGCPKKGCDAGAGVFTAHPLMRNDAATHLEECGHDFADDDDMVRKFCTQVISDDKKAATIEWARKWNNDLVKEYGEEGREEGNF